MNNVSLTYFVDFVLKAGTPKLTVVKEFKYRDDYKPYLDFYKELRDRIVDVHKNGGTIADLQSWAASLAPPKQGSYLGILAGYRRFFGGRKQYPWFDPPSTVCQVGGLPVTINPELGLEIQGVRHLIKVYWKDDPPLTKPKVQLILHLMEQAFARISPPATFGLLDARKGKLHTVGAPTPGLAALLAGEAATFMAVYSQI